MAVGIGFGFGFLCAGSGLGECRFLLPYSKSFLPFLPAAKYLSFLSFVFEVSNRGRECWLAIGAVEKGALGGGEEVIGEMGVEVYCVAVWAFVRGVLARKRW